MLLRLIKDIWWYLMGWRKGLPKENGLYMFKIPNAYYEQDPHYYVVGCRHLKKATHYKRIRGP